MPDKDKMVKIVSSKVADLKKVRVPGIEKAFEEMTIGELVHLRTGDEAAEITVEAVSSDVSVNSGKNWDDSLLVMEPGRLVKTIRTPTIRPIKETPIKEMPIRPK